MIVSSAIAVLPVWRSPMISSRWPRPIGIIASIALMPVCIGSLTGLAVDDARRDPLDRVERPSSRSAPCRRSAGRAGSTTRPMSASPTGTEMIRFVRLDGVPFLDLATSRP